VNPLEIGPYGPFGQPKWAHFSISLVNNIAMPKGMRAQITKKKPYSLFSRAKEHKHNSVRVIKSNQPSAVKKKKKKKREERITPDHYCQTLLLFNLFLAHFILQRILI